MEEGKQSFKIMMSLWQYVKDLKNAQQAKSGHGRGGKGRRHKTHKVHLPINSIKRERGGLLKRG